jgi:gamma-glutamylaminecyclotransferase
MSDAHHLVFVYGSLMRGERYHHLLGGVVCLRSIATPPRYELVDLGPYPAMVAGGATAVSGELYRVDGTVLAALDELEGHPGIYRRTTIELADGTQADTYLMPLAAGPRIGSGDWRRR